MDKMYITGIWHSLPLRRLHFVLMTRSQQSTLEKAPRFTHWKGPHQMVSHGKPQKLFYEMEENGKKYYPKGLIDKEFESHFLKEKQKWCEILTGFYTVLNL